MSFVTQINKYDFMILSLFFFNFMSSNDDTESDIAIKYVLILCWDFFYVVEANTRSGPLRCYFFDDDRILSCQYNYKTATYPGVELEPSLEPRVLPSRS